MSRKKFMSKGNISNKIRYFTEDSAPYWLTGEGSVEGSTMDNRWFWQSHVLTLEVGESVETDFHTITRVV